MCRMISMLFGNEKKGDYRFPNLLTDKDFVEYYWTLPFTTL